MEKPGLPQIAALPKIIIKLLLQDLLNVEKSVVFFTILRLME